MRIRDLLPDKDSLITRDYWLKRSQLGQPMMTYIPTCLPTLPMEFPISVTALRSVKRGQNSNWRYSSTRNPNLIGLPFGTGEAGSYPVVRMGRRTVDSTVRGFRSPIPRRAEQTIATRPLPQPERIREAAESNGSKCLQQNSGNES